MHEANSNQGNSQPPVLGRFPLGPRFGVALYVLLLGATTLTLWGHNFPGRLGKLLGELAPWVFLAFVVLFTVYRLTLVRARRYSAFKAFFQIAVLFTVLAFLLPSSWVRFSKYDASSSRTSELAGLLQSPDPKVRALAAELVGFRGEQQYGALLVGRLKDEAPEVRRRAHAALVKLAGQDLGGPDDEQAFEAWRERFP